MKVFPIIPIWLMAIICFVLLFFLIKGTKIRNFKNFIKTFIVDILIIILLFTINLRIMYLSDDSEYETNNLDIIFVIDTTISMNALDYNGENTRLSGVKEDCNYIINHYIGARFSLITFDTSSNINVPFTYDNNLVLEAINLLSPKSYSNSKGTNLNTSLESILYDLEKSSDDSISILFFISDGEVTDESDLVSYSEVSSYLNSGAVLGYGTEIGGYMKETDYYGNTDYITYYDSKTYEKKKAISYIDEDNLKTLASDMKIDYVHMNKTSDIDNVLKNIDKLLEDGVKSSLDQSSYSDTYFYFVIPLIILLLIKYRQLKRIL